MMRTGESVCTVCGEAAQESNSAVCTECDQRFHLNLRSDVDGKDCGDVWIHEQDLSLRFACFACLGRQGSAGEPPVGKGH
jgi:hypothetical protein